MISLSEDSLPKAIIVATSIAIGAASDSMDADWYIINLNIIPNDNPFPKNLSKCLIINCVNKTNTRIKSERTKGEINSLNIYLFIIFNYSIIKSINSIISVMLIVLSEFISAKNNL